MPPPSVPGDVVGDLLQLLGRVMPEHLGDGRAEPRGVVEYLAHARREGQGVVGAVDQGEGAQALQRVVEGEVVLFCRPGEQVAEGVSGELIGVDGERLDHGQREPVEPVEGAADRRGAACPRGQPFEVGGDRRDQLGARGHERAELIVGALPDPLSELHHCNGMFLRIRAAWHA
ncbi:hypothetical protein ACFQGX_12085 [Nonomuraea dietziae]|uniref:hypothetical protein n=1 Tax=Nonomuraea dietziae TaxID=65515 RepID=UPI0036121359